MTGVAAQWCGTAPDEYRQKLEAEWKEAGREPPEWGTRRAILGDLSPAATFIAANYNIPFDVDEFAQAAQSLLSEVEKEVGWMYRTRHSDGTIGRINYTVWSEVFACPECGTEIVFLEEALDRSTGRIRSRFPCRRCAVQLVKRQLLRLRTAEHDPLLNRTVSRTKRVPVFLNYTAGGKKGYEKPLDIHDRERLRRISHLPPPLEIPTDRMMHAPDDVEVWGDQWRSGVCQFSYLHHLYLPRAAQALAAVWRRVDTLGMMTTADQGRTHKKSRLAAMIRYFAEQAITGMSLQNRYSATHYSQVNQYMPGLIRLLSQHAECHPDYILGGKRKRLKKAFRRPVAQGGSVGVTTGDCSRLMSPSRSIDYVFTDPPFGSNLTYAELNFLIEAFHGVFTSGDAEAIESKIQNKTLQRYQRMMRECFREYCRVLKPGRWMTVVFHNSKNAVWNAIQESLWAAGFVVADVRILDKKAGTFNQMMAAGAVKKDLVISAYKPNGGLEQRFRLRAGTEEAAWDFIETHLRQLPAFAEREGRSEVMRERQDFLLYDRMVAFHVERRAAVPLSASGFYAGLRERFVERDGMFFLPEQVPRYESGRLRVKGLFEPAVVVRDEETAIRWLRSDLKRKPQTFQELHPNFMREIGGWLKHEARLELTLLLEENFLCYDGDGPVPGPIHSWLSTTFKDLRNLPKGAARLRSKAEGRWHIPDPAKAPEVERLRQRALLREFHRYAGDRVRRMPSVRMEAVRAGFRDCWQKRDDETIIAVGERIPRKALEEDPKLLMWYDNALTRSGAR